MAAHIKTQVIWEADPARDPLETCVLGVYPKVEQPTPLQLSAGWQVKCGHEAGRQDQPSFVSNS